MVGGGGGGWNGFWEWRSRSRGLRREERETVEEELEPGMVTTDEMKSDNKNIIEV